MPDMDAEVAAGVCKRLCLVRRRITQAAEQAGKAPNHITLVAVSKTFGAEHIMPALAAGQRHFGENRVQEAKAKWPQLKQSFPDAVLHLIGPLQTNKVQDAVELFDVIETVDRPKLVARLASECQSQNRWPKLLIEVNTGEEPQKAGVAPDQLEHFIADLRSHSSLDVAGLMCIPPIDEEAALHFALLEKLGRRFEVGELSMGMSHDFETAIALGATEVRVGRAIFGPRG